MTTELARFEPTQAIQINRYPKDKYHVLIPGDMTTQMSPFLRPVARQVEIDPDPQHGEVYPISQRKQGNRWVATEVGLSAVGLSKLASVAGMLDVPQASGRVDSGRDPGLVTYRSTMAIRLPDGEWRVLTRECTVKLATLEKEIREQKTKKGKENKDWDSGRAAPWSDERIETEIRKELLLKEKFMERLAETGAKNRVIRSALALRQKYTPDELDKPFVLAAVIPDANQPELRERLLDQASSAVSTLFGPGNGQVAQEPRQLTSSQPDPAEVAEAAAESEGGEITIEEMGSVVTGEGDDEPPTVTGDGEVIDEPDFGDGPTETPANTGGRPADWLAVTLRERADAAGGSKAPGSATQAQRANLKRVLRAIGTEGTRLVLAAAFDLTDLPKISEAQADAILDAAEVKGFDTDLVELVDALRGEAR